MNRRGFLQSILAAGVMPAIVKAETLMPCVGLTIPAKEIILPGAQLIVLNTNLAISRVFSVTLDSLAYLEAKAEGLVEIGRHKGYGRHRTTVVDFAMERPKHSYEVRKLVL